MYHTSRICRCITKCTPSTAISLYFILGKQKRGCWTLLWSLASDMMKNIFSSLFWGKIENRKSLTNLLKPACCTACYDTWHIASCNHKAIHIFFHLHDRYVLLHIFGVPFDTNNHAYGSLKSKDLALWNIVMSYRDGCFTVAVFFFFCQICRNIYCWRRFSWWKCKTRSW